MPDSFADDLNTINRIEAIPSILEVVCRTTGLGFAAVARVTEHRWVACAVRDEISFGLSAGGELTVETTICDEIRNTGQLVVIDHASADDIFCDHPTPKMYGFESYISVPIMLPDGRFFGTLCAIDPKPASLRTPQIIGMFKLFADLISFHIDAQERLKLSETALTDERQTAQLREQFIAVLGHDLRNPLNAINGGAQVLLGMKLPETATPVVAMLQRSAARMAGLIENVLDFARGRLGGGLSLARTADLRLETILEQVIAEVRTSWPTRDIRCELTMPQAVACDGPRLAQMFSNLLANALTHGDPDGPVWVAANCDETNFELTVTNLGQPIPPTIIDRLFQPFTRATADSRQRGEIVKTGGTGQQGLGLGLYIAAEIARAHEGTLTVESSPAETRFTFRMPMLAEKTAHSASVPE